MYFLIILISLLFLACGETGRPPSDEELELNHNYRLLKAYFYHPERIKKYAEYEGWEVDFMYKSLEDYFCGAGHTGNCKSRYTFYYPPQEINVDDRIEQIENTPRYYSFGFERIIVKDTLVISTVYPNSPANGVLKKRDKLLFANDVSLTDADINRYLNYDSLFKPSTAFTVLRGEETLILDTIVKSEVQKPTVFLDSLEGIPFIRVTEYKIRTNNTNGTYAEFKEVLKEIEGAKTAIIDIRGNPGGNIDHCSAMAAELVPLESELVYDVYHHYDERRGNVIDTVHDFARNYLKTPGAGVNIKWIILMNRGSASCSERFTAAVKYNRRETVIIGQTSYGKGIGQTYRKTYLGGFSYITCIQSYYPDGETFHGIGIPPKVQIDPEKGTDAIYIAALEAAINDFGAEAPAKRLSSPVRLGTLPPEHKAETTEPGMHRRALFHQWE